MFGLVNFLRGNIGKSQGSSERIYANLREFA